MADSNTANYGWVKPEVGASAATWGGKLNTDLDEIDADLKAVSDAANTAALKLPLSGGTMTGDIALGDPTPGSASSAGFRGHPVNVQDATYTLVLKDAGKLILHTSGSAHTWTLPANTTVSYPLGTVIRFGNIGAGNVTLAKAGGVQILNSLGADQNLSVSQYANLELVNLATDVWFYRYF
jgi:hypothetical protein